MKASDLFVKCLEEEGVEMIFGIPGEENLDMLESLRTSSIELILTRHEQGAGFMAATYGRLTGRVGVCMSTLGPGATNFVTAAAYANLAALPMMMITGQKPIKTSKQGDFQILDVVSMMSPITKYSQQIVSGDNVAPRVREAVRRAEEERPGAVHLELPEDIAAEDTSMVPIARSQVRRPMAEEKAVGRAVDLLREAKRPLIMLGGGANRYRVSRAVLDLIEKTKLPFFATQMGKGVVDERHPQYLGTAALSDNDYLHCAINRADLILNIGHDVIEKPPFIMKQGGMKVVHINYYSAKVDPVYFPQVEVVGDIAASVRAIENKLGDAPEWDLEYFCRVKTDLDLHLKEGSDDTRFPVLPQHLVSTVRDVMPEDGIIALDNGVYKIWFARNYPAYQPNTVLLDNALATMGAGLPSAMGAKIVYPNKKVMAICGDGGFMMNSQEMETAVRLGLDLVVLILNDSAYGMIKWKQTGMDFENWGLDFQNPDFVKYAEAYGATGHRIESIDALKPTLETALKGPGVHLIDCPVDYSENVEALITKLKEKTCLI